MIHVFVLSINLFEMFEDSREVTSDSWKRDVRGSWSVPPLLSSTTHLLALVLLVECGVLWYFLSTSWVWSVLEIEIPLQGSV